MQLYFCVFPSSDDRSRVHRTPGLERFHARSHEWLAESLQPRRTGRREHPPLQAVVLGIPAHATASERFGEHAPVPAGASPFFARRENCDPRSMVVHSPTGDIRYQTSIRTTLKYLKVAAMPSRPAALTVRDGPASVSTQPAASFVRLPESFFSCIHSNSSGDGEPRDASDLLRFS